MTRYINKKLRAAIEQGKPLRWEFGKYSKWYTGLKLIAYSGYAETGRVYETVVFATMSIDGASVLCQELNDVNVKYSDWDKAVKDHHNHYLKKRNPS